IDDGTNPTIPSIKKGRGGRLPRVPNGNTIAGTTGNPTASPSPQGSPTIPPGAPTNTNQLNKAPVKDLAKEVNDLKTANAIDLQAPLKLSATAKIDQDGKIAKGSFKFIKVESSDPKLVDVAKDAVAAFNDSNLLTYLKSIGGERVNFLLQQDQ